MEGQGGQCQALSLSALAIPHPEPEAGACTPAAAEEEEEEQKKIDPIWLGSRSWVSNGDGYAETGWEYRQLVKASCFRSAWQAKQNICLERWDPEEKWRTRRAEGGIKFDNKKQQEAGQENF